MSIDDFGPEILQDFLTESGELLEQLEGDLVGLESTPEDLDLLNQIFRALHTIKGSASFLALTNLVELAHSSESALNTARNGDFIIGTMEMDLLLAAVDMLKVQFNELSAGETELSAADSELIRKLTLLGDGRSLKDAHEVTVPDEESNTSSKLLSEIDTYGRLVRQISLNSSKLDLIDHLAMDIEETLDLTIVKLNDLTNRDTRSFASRNLSEFFEDIARTVDFFEIDEVSQLANSLVAALEGVETLEDSHINQMIPRLHAVCLLLREQTKELANQRVLIWKTGTLLERLSAVSQGKELSVGLIEPDATPEQTLANDGVSYISLDDPSIQRVQDPTNESACDTPVRSLVPDIVDSESEPASAASKAPVPAIEQTIRVEVSRLESLMNLVGELVLQKNRIGAMAENIVRSDMGNEFIEQMEITASTLDRVTSDIQLAVMQTRMQPLDKLFGKYPRLIRDLATKTGKNIVLEIIGGDTEVDKSIIEELGDPLVHLLRNSVDHGIEMPQDRLEAGKDEQGVIQLIAGHEGSHVNVRIIDNGKGLSREIIGNKAVARGLVSTEQLSTLSDEEVFRFIFEAGFSTVDQVSNLSGRGVGMDVVRTNIENKLKGHIMLESKEDVGTTICINIPLTVAIMPAMMVAVSDEIYAIPLTNITEIVHPTPDMLSNIGDKPVIHLRGKVYPLISAQETFHVPGTQRENEDFVVIIGFNQRIIGLKVSSVIGQQEIVIKPLRGIQRQGPISGATVRNDGCVSLIVDVAELMSVSKNRRTPACGTV